MELKGRERLQQMMAIAESGRLRGVPLPHVLGWRAQRLRLAAADCLRKGAERVLELARAGKLRPEHVRAYLRLARLHWAASLAGAQHEELQEAGGAIRGRGVGLGYNAGESRRTGTPAPA